MDISSLGITGVAVITVICFLVGQVVKATGLDNKWIPHHLRCVWRGAGHPRHVYHARVSSLGLFDRRRRWHRLRPCGHWYQSGL